MRKKNSRKKRQQETKSKAVTSKEQSGLDEWGELITLTHLRVIQESRATCAPDHDVKTLREEARKTALILEHDLSGIGWRKMVEQIHTMEREFDKPLSPRFWRWIESLPTIKRKRFVAGSAQAVYRHFQQSGSVRCGSISIRELEAMVNPGLLKD